MHMFFVQALLTSLNFDSIQVTVSQPLSSIPERVNRRGGDRRNVPGAGPVPGAGR